MRLLAELPEIAPAVESGKLSLTHLNLAQTHFNKEEKAIAQNASYAEAKTVTIQVDKELASKIQLLKGLLAHSEANISDGERLHKVADMAIEKLSAPGKWKLFCDTELKLFVKILLAKRVLRAVLSAASLFF